MTVWYIVNMESFRSVADRFGLSKGHAHNLFMLVVNLLIENIDEWIEWPTGVRARENVQKFNDLHGNQIQGVFGCLDGSHIEIPNPKNDNSYINRHRYPSINLQAICNSKKKFIYIFVGWPGSAHDSRVWTNSPLHNDLEEKRDEVRPPETFLLSDSAYELRTFNMNPYKAFGILSRQEKKFNTQLSKVRVLIEQVFGRLKGIFRRLKKLESTKVRNSSRLVTVACIIFHNIAIDDKIYFDDQQLLNEEEEEYNNPEEELENADIQQRRAVDKREAIVLRNIIKNAIM